jgi:hypothetical protein
MNRDDQWNAIILLRQDSAEMTVPSMAMHNIASMFVVLKSVQRRTAPKAERSGCGQVKLLVSSSKPMTLKLPFSKC